MNVCRQGPALSLIEQFPLENLDLDLLTPAWTMGTWRKPGAFSIERRYFVNSDND
jgi:hypothetical protein